MQSVAFFRNLNLGHPGSPDGTGLVQAFADAGGLSVRSFQTNGTVIFTADDPIATANRARALLSDRYDDAVLVRSADRVAQIVADFPVVEVESDHYREMVVLYDEPSAGIRSAEALARDGLVQLLRVDDDAALGLVWKPKNTAGNMTAVIERMLGTTGTSRTLGTLQRLSRQLT